ncbi:hypothetical protein E2C01_067358 [Portunus trituberculatus]|uniref:Uncharacterized protein n=1 Tax=Portunus trituberculatus TaxID=210409 RepID=A0A5B7HJK5_PORTR|nr:hypothetical protein [Portunus trituberculatus]
MAQLGAYKGRFVVAEHFRHSASGVRSTGRDGTVSQHVLLRATTVDIRPIHSKASHQMSCSPIFSPFLSLESVVFRWTVINL